MRDRSIGGVLWENVGKVYRVVRGSLGELTATEGLHDLFDYLFRRSGISEDVLLIFLPETDEFRRVMSIWGPFEREGSVSNEYGTTVSGEFTIMKRI